jgi:PAS domain S-box-containing protein
MKRKPNISDDPAELRRRAEARLRDQRKGQRSKAGDQKSEADTVRLLYELEVHQIELEMQNAELQKARDDMEAALERYTDLYDFAPVGYFSIDAEGLILEVNLTGAALLGVERSRLIRLRLERFVAPVSRTMFRTFLEKVFAGTRDQVCEALLLKEGGGTFWASFQATAAVSPQGARKWCRVAFGDITARKQAEEERARLAAIVESSEDAIVSNDLNSVITSWNAGAEKLFGYTAQEAIGRPVTMLIPRNHIGEELDILGRICRGERLKNYETVRRRKDGKLLEVSLTVSPIINSHGQVVGESKITRDITERKRVEAAHRRIEMLSASNRKLEQEIARRQTVEKALRRSERDQSRLLEQSRHMQEQLRHLAHLILLAQEEERKRISRELHDVIGQTLTGINVHLASLKIAPTSNSKGLQKKITSTQRLVEKSVDIVHRFARELRPSVLDDLGLIPALHAFMEGLTTRTGVRASLTAFAAVERSDTAKRTVLFRVAQEALTNVARHAHASRAEVKIRKLDDAICMTITDNGKGFRQELVLHSKKKNRLGLLGMRERVQMVGGNLVVHSAPGKGTTIRVQIPIAEVRGARVSLEPHCKSTNLVG